MEAKRVTFILFLIYIFLKASKLAFFGAKIEMDALIQI